MIGLGVLICDQCGHKTEFNHPTEIEPCSQCGGKAFSRQPLKP
ncbi:zinc ribbon-containing protein [Salmonella enterica]